MTVSQQFLYLVNDQVDIKRFLQHNIEQVRSLHANVRLRAADQNNRQVFNGGQGSYGFGEFESIHHRHHEIGDDQVGALSLKHLKSLLTEACLHDHEPLIL